MAAGDCRPTRRRRGRKVARVGRPRKADEVAREAVEGAFFGVTRLLLEVRERREIRREWLEARLEELQAGVWGEHRRLQGT